MENGTRNGRGFTLWFTGLSGAGKTTIAEIVERELRNRLGTVEVLDGDIVRTNLSKGLGFSREDRDTNVLRIGFVANLLTRNGVAVIERFVLTISPSRTSTVPRRFLSSLSTISAIVVLPAPESPVNHNVNPRSYFLAPFSMLILPCSFVPSDYYSS